MMRKAKVGRSGGKFPPPPPLKTQDDIFPWYCPYIIFLAALVVRIYYVSQPKNWWILHPDEIYQSLEVAHSEVYGYGFRPYEYLTSTTHVNDTRIRQKEISLGMAAMRSFIYPSFYMLISWILQAVSVDIRPFMAWKISHGMVTSLLLPAVHVFTRTLFQSHDVAVMAASLVASSVHLNVFGTHTLVNSFLAPVVFFSLATLIKQIQRASGSDCVVVPKVTENGKTSQQAVYSPKEEREMTNKDSTLQLSHSPFCCDILPSGIQGLKKTNELVPPVVDIVSWISRLHIYLKSLPITMQVVELVFSSLVLTIVCYIRPDVALFSCIVLLPFTTCSLDLVHKYMQICLGVLAAILVCVWCDFTSYGHGTITPLNWFYFNILTNHSASFFGSMSSSFYTSVLFQQCRLNFLMLILATVLFVYMRVSGKCINCERVVKLLTSFVVLLVIYSLQSHKEPRHIHNLFCLFFILVSWIFISFCKSVLTTNQTRSVICAFHILCVSIAYSCFPSPTNKTNLSWVYGHVHDSNDVSMCLEFVGQSKDATGVFMDRTIHMSGGYSILHKDIPILVLLINEFNEFDNESRTMLPSWNGGSSTDVHVSTFSRVSDFISVSSTPYLLKRIISMSKYNYMILKEDRRFVKYGFKEVFKSGKMKVMRRTFDAKDEIRLQETGNKISIGTNATVLNYEGKVLFDLKRNDKAIERFETSLKLDPSIISNYQFLSNLYYDIGDLPKAKRVMLECYAIYSKNMCMTS